MALKRHSRKTSDVLSQADEPPNVTPPLLLPSVIVQAGAAARGRESEILHL